VIFGKGAKNPAKVIYINVSVGLNYGVFNSSELLSSSSPQPILAFYP
jgi:hypothetical protein